jgi:hypothetical protein
MSRRTPKRTSELRFHHDTRTAALIVVSLGPDCVTLPLSTDQSPVLSADATSRRSRAPVGKELTWRARTNLPNGSRRARRRATFMRGAIGVSSCGMRFLVVAGRRSCAACFCLLFYSVGRAQWHERERASSTRSSSVSCRHRHTRGETRRRACRIMFTDPPFSALALHPRARIVRPPHPP